MHLQDKIKKNIKNKDETWRIIMEKIRSLRGKKPKLIRALKGDPNNLQTRMNHLLKILREHYTQKFEPYKEYDGNIIRRNRWRSRRTNNQLLPRIRSNKETKK